MLELTEKPLEEPAEGAQNGLKVVEMEPEGEVGTEAESQLIPPAGEPVPESAAPPPSTDLPVPLKEDPAQSVQSEAHLTSQDLRRAKRIRVKPEPSACFRATLMFDCSLSAVSLPHCLLPSQMDVQVGGTWAMAEKLFKGCFCHFPEFECFSQDALRLQPLLSLSCFHKMFLGACE